MGCNCESSYEAVDERKLIDKGIVKTPIRKDSE